MADEATATDLARGILVDPTTFRRWLRRLVSQGHPIVRRHKPWDRWLFTADEANELTQLYVRQHGATSRGPLVAIRFQGSELREVQLRELTAFFDAIETIYETAWEAPQLRGLQPELPTLRHVSAGSPIDLVIVIPAIGAAITASAMAVNHVVTAINSALGGRVDRARTRAETAAIEAKSRAEVDQIDAETRAIEQKARSDARKADLEIRELEAAVDRETAEPHSEPRLRPVEVVDPAGILAEYGRDLPRLPRSVQAIAAEQALVQSPVEIEVITISYARPRRRRVRRRRS